jgi:hypothetical protein
MLQLRGATMPIIVDVFESMPAQWVHYVQLDGSLMCGETSIHAAGTNLFINVTCPACIDAIKRQLDEVVE